MGFNVHRPTDKDVPAGVFGSNGISNVIVKVESPRRLCTPKDSTEFFGADTHMSPTHISGGFSPKSTSTNSVNSSPQSLEKVPRPISFGIHSTGM